MARTKKEVRLEWYVLNGCRWDWEDKGRFDNFPYAFHETDVRPWNVFGNWPFREAAIKLAKNYYKGKFSLETLKADNMERPYDYKTNTFGKPYVKSEVAELKNNFEAFKYKLMCLLRHEEWARTEYEICVADWTPVMLNKEGKRVTWYYGEEPEPVYDVKMDKIDCYQQVLPNQDTFAKYVLMEVNGTLLTKEEVNKKKQTYKK